MSLHAGRHALATLLRCGLELRRGCERCGMGFGQGKYKEAANQAAGIYSIITTPILWGVHDAVDLSYSSTMKRKDLQVCIVRVWPRFGFALLDFWPLGLVALRVF